jgi:hypothetical protein
VSQGTEESHETRPETSLKIACLLDFPIHNRELTERLVRGRDEEGSRSKAEVKYTTKIVRLQVLMAVTVFWDMTPSCLPPSSGKTRQLVLENLSFYQCYGVTSQKTVIFNGN